MAKQNEALALANEGELPASKRDYYTERAKRHHEVRAKTVHPGRIAKRDLERGRREYPEDVSHLRPKTRAECVNGPRPCAFVSCAFHLYLDVNPDNGAIKLNFPDLEVWEMKESCALDIMDRGGETLEGTGDALNITRERVRQIEVSVLREILQYSRARRILFADGSEDGEKPRKVVRLTVVK